MVHAKIQEKKLQMYSSFSTRSIKAAQTVTDLNNKNNYRPTDLLAIDVKCQLS